MCLCGCVLYSYVAWFNCVQFSVGFWCFWWMRLYVRKQKICDMLMLFPNISISGGQIHTFKTNAIADLIIQSISSHENQVISQVQCEFQRLRNLDTFQKFKNYNSSLTTLYLTPYPTHLPPNLVVSGRGSFSEKPYLRVPLFILKMTIFIVSILCKL